MNKLKEQILHLPDSHWRNFFLICPPEVLDIIQNALRVETENNFKEALGVDPDGNRVKCGDCEQWTDRADAVPFPAEETVRCPKCAAYSKAQVIDEFVRRMEEMLNGDTIVSLDDVQWVAEEMKGEE